MEDSLGKLKTSRRSVKESYGVTSSKLVATSGNCPWNFILAKLLFLPRIFSFLLYLVLAITDNPDLVSASAPLCVIYHVEFQ